MKNQKNQKGFTLIELALIIAVLGILGAVGAVKLASMTDEAKAAAKKTVIANARSGLAIALAKDADGKVSATELASFLDGVTSSAAEHTSGTIKLEGYTLTMSGTPSTEITGITGATP